MVFVNYIYDMVVDAQLHRFYGIYIPCTGAKMSVVGLILTRQGRSICFHGVTPGVYVLVRTCGTPTTEIDLAFG